jgi:hypothetical protein
MVRPHDPQPVPRPVVVRLIESHLGSRDVAKIVYGSVVGLAVVVALEHHSGSPAQTVAAIAGTAIAVALAEAYSEFVGIETRERRHVGRSELPRLAAEAATVALGAGFPVVFFLLAAVDVLALPTAFSLAKWTGVGLMFAYGFAASRLAGSSLATALLHAAAVGAIGGALIALKALVH